MTNSSDVKPRMLVFLGPGRNGTTSLYHSFCAIDDYFLFADKECGALTFGFDAYRDNISKISKDSVFVEITPSNLYFSALLAKNLNSLHVEPLGVIVISRPVIPRMISLYLHHRKIRTIDCSFDEFVKRCHSSAKNSIESGRHDLDLTYIGLAEYKKELLAQFPAENIYVVNYDNLYSQINEFLERNGLPTINEIRRNQGYEPKREGLHRVMLLLYKAFNLRRFSGLSKMKTLYIRFNASKSPVFISNETRDILMSYEEDWLNSLSQYAHV